jgi:hypothetical protein
MLAGNPLFEAGGTEETRPNLIGFWQRSSSLLVNSGTKLFYDVMGSVPRPPLKCLIQSYAHNQFAYLDHAGADVIRTLWLAVLCLIGLVAMIATRFGIPTTPSNVRASPEQRTVGKSFSQDTLTKADKLEIAYVRVPVVAVEPVMLITRAPDETPSQPPSSVAPKIVSRHWHDPSAKKSAAASPDRRQIQEPKKIKNDDRAKATVDLRPCRRPEGFAGLLRALNLSPGCDT